MNARGLLAIMTSAFVIKAAGSALAVLMFMAIGRASTLVGFGDFAFGFAAAQFFAVVFGFGAETVALRSTSTALAENTQFEARAHAALTLRVTLAGMGGALLMGLGAICVGVSPSFALSISALAGILALSETLSSILRGYGWVTSALIPREIIWRLAILLVACGVWLSSAKLEAQQWIWLSACLLVMVVLCQWFLFAERPHGIELRAAPSKGVGSVIAFVLGHWQIWVIAVLNGFGAQLPILLVRALLQAEATALLFAAMKISGVIALPLVAVGPVVAPQISRAWAKRDMQGLQKIGAQTAGFSSAGAILGLGTIVTAGPMLLGFFGPDFLAAQPALIILAFGQLFAGLVGPTGFAMLMMGHEREALIFLCAATCVALVLTLGLSLTYGIVGAAVGISMLLLFNKGACYLFLMRHHGIHMSLLGWLKKTAPVGEEQ